METILVIEDDEHLRDILGETLEEAGYAVTLSAGPDDAIQQAQGQRFHLVLSDVRMAGSTDGVGAVEQIKKRQPQIRSIIMTGYASQEVPVRAARMQADDYLLKADNAFGVAELLRVVRRTLDREERTDPGLLGRLMSLPGQLARLPLKALFEARLGDLERERKAVLQQLFVLVRAGHLNQESARLAWGQLEAAEVSFHKLSAAAEIAELRRRYRDLAVVIQDGKISGGQPPVPFSLWVSFYERVRLGQIELPQFERAARLRRDPEARNQSVEDYALYHWLWGDPGRAPLESFSGLTLGEFVLHEVMPGGDAVTTYRATRSDGPGLFLVQALADSPEARAMPDAIAAHGAVFFVTDWPWAADGQRSTFRQQLVPGGMAWKSLWALVRPVFVYVSEQHRAGQVAGVLTPDDIFFEGDGRLRVRFEKRAPIRGNAICCNVLHLAFTSPEAAQGQPSAASDQYSLATLILFFLMGESSGQAFLIHCSQAALGQRPLIPGLSAESSGAAHKLEQILQRLRNQNPFGRAPGLAQAIVALDGLESDRPAVPA